MPQNNVGMFCATWSGTNEVIMDVVVNATVFQVKGDDVRQVLAVEWHDGTIRGAVNMRPTKDFHRSFVSEYGTNPYNVLVIAGTDAFRDAIGGSVHKAFARYRDQAVAVFDASMVSSVERNKKGQGLLFGVDMATPIGAPLPLDRQAPLCEVLRRVWRAASHDKRGE